MRPFRFSKSFNWAHFSKRTLLWPEETGFVDIWSSRHLIYLPRHPCSPLLFTALGGLGRSQEGEQKMLLGFSFLCSSPGVVKGQRAITKLPEDLSNLNNQISATYHLPRDASPDHTIKSNSPSHSLIIVLLYHHHSTHFYLMLLIFMFTHLCFLFVSSFEM